MKSSILLNRLKELAKDDTSVRALIVLVERIFDDCANLMKATVRSMPEYTLHDEIHLERMIELMGRLMPSETLARLNPLEIGSLLLAVAFHDVGMSPSQKELDSVFKKSGSKEATDLRIAYQAFREAYPHLLGRQKELNREKRTAEANEIESFFLSEFLRRTHAERGKRFVFDRYGSTLRYEYFDFAARLAEVCYSHSQEPASLKQLPCWELVRSPGEYCNWRFVGVLLRLADILDFDPKRTPVVLFEHLGIRSAISIREWKKHQSVRAWDIRPERIAFSAQCADPVIEKCVKDFVGLIDNELVAAGAVILDFHDPAQLDLPARYELRLPVQVDTRGIGPVVGAQGPLYDYVDLSFYLDKENIMSLTMGIALYADPVLFLRELLQNAVDACRHRAALHATQPELGPFESQVVVRFVAGGDHGLIEVDDNGMGMDEDIVRNYFARVGRSYYKSGRFLEERAKAKLEFQPVSQFGIGILSAFMVGKTMSVQTLRIGSGKRPLWIEIEGEGSLFWFRRSQRASPGTCVTVVLKSPSHEFLRAEEDAARKNSEPSLYKTVAEVAPHVEFPITIEENGRCQQFAGKWELPSAWRSASRAATAIDLDVSSDGPDGLDGIGRIFILEEAGMFCPKVYLDASDEATEEEDLRDGNEDLRDYLAHRSGYIQHVHVDRTVKEGLSHGFSTEIDSRGRWSQLGFCVPSSLFAEHEHWTGRNVEQSIGFPFPVWYDLNLSGRFVFPLSADRKSILPTKHAKALCDRICSVFAGLMLKSLGRKKVAANLKFFEQLSNGDDKHDLLVKALATFLRM